jgi:hypothetical protein
LRLCNWIAFNIFNDDDDAGVGDDDGATKSVIKT